MVPAGAVGHVRGIKAVHVIAAPHDGGGHPAAVGQFHDALDGFAHDAFAVIHGAQNSIQDAVVRVMAVDEPDVALVPDAVGASDDVVDDVGVDRIEAAHGLHLGTAGRDQLREVTALHLEDLPDVFAR